MHERQLHSKFTYTTLCVRRNDTCIQDDTVASAMRVLLVVATCIVCACAARRQGRPVVDGRNTSATA
jgi:hypothetical protein